MNVTVSTLTDAVTVVPHLLGYAPHESLVVLPLGSTAPVARVDLPRTAMETLDVLESLAPVLLRNQSSECLLLAFTDREDWAAVVLDTVRSAVPNPTGVRATLTVSRDAWTETHTLQHGRITQSDRDRTAVEFVAQGRPAPLSSRTELAQRYSPTQSIDPAEVAGAVSALHHDRDDFTAATIEALDHAIAEHRSTRTLPSDSTSASIVVGLDLTAVRDQALEALDPATARLDTDLWAHLTRTAPTGYRDHPAALAALAAWLGGDGASAWTALDVQTTRTTLGSLVATALSRGISPQVWTQIRDDAGSPD